MKHKFEMFLEKLTQRNVTKLKRWKNIHQKRQIHICEPTTSDSTLFSILIEWQIKICSLFNCYLQTLHISAACLIFALLFYSPSLQLYLLIQFVSLEKSSGLAILFVMLRNVFNFQLFNWFENFFAYLFSFGKTFHNNKKKNSPPHADERENTRTMWW